jgi:protein tyrosine/serine phosphatase
MKGAVGLILVTGISLGGWAGYLRASGNIHEIEPGAVFRTAQLSRAQLSSLLQDKHVRTVVNLRGPNPGRSWYDDELAATTRAGVRYVSLPMSANREPNEALLTRLIETLRTVEMPVVIHCEGGADRTGLAAALYELLVMGRSAEVASAQLSFRYGHFPWLTSRTGAMDATFWRVAAENSVKLQAEMPE